MKSGPDTLGTAGNKSGRAKHKNGTDALDTVENDALDTVENESESAKHENGTAALGTAENVFGRAEHENGTRRPRYRQTRVWARK
jgi:hypothetical protein